jgi:DNA-binding MarR family transcriptional regulator
MRPKRESAARWISIIHRYGHTYVGNRLKPAGLGKGQFPFLIKLYENSGITQDDLAEMLKFDKTTVARVVSSLEKNGFVTRKVDPADRRAKRIYLTDRAMESKAFLFEVLHEWTDLLMKGLNETEKKTVVALLKKMVANAEDAVDADCENRSSGNG